MHASALESAMVKMLRENNPAQLFTTMDIKENSLSTALVQLFKTENKMFTKMSKVADGVMCFVKNSSNENQYTFNLYNLEENTIVWKAEVHNRIKYSEATDYLHTLETVEGTYLLNFTSISDARNFKEVVQDKIRLAAKMSVENVPISPPTNFKHVTHVSFDRQRGFEIAGEVNNLRLLFENGGPDSPISRHNSRTDLTDSEKPAGSGKIITKSDIGFPYNFEHVSHVGYNPHTGFDVVGQNSEMGEIIQNDGGSGGHSQNQNNKRFIVNFLSEYKERLIN